MPNQTHGLSVDVYGGLHKVLTMPANVLLAKFFCNVPLRLTLALCES